MWPFRRKLFTPTNIYAKVHVIGDEIRITRLYETPTGLLVSGRWGHAPEVGDSLWVYNPDNTVDGEFTRQGATWEPA